jgi:hypothetical protein
VAKVAAAKHKEIDPVPGRGACAFVPPVDIANPINGASPAIPSSALNAARLWQKSRGEFHL